MLSVFFFHAWLPVSQLMFATFHILPSTVWRGDSLVANLNIGVAMFFVLSGFLIYRPFVSAHAAARAKPNAADYMQRRALRIYPAYWLVFAVLLASGAFVHITRPQIAVNLALVQTWFAFSANSGIGQAWTLVVEVSFYAFAPVWSALIRRGARGRNPIRIEVAGALFLTALGFSASWVQATGSPPPWFTAFFPHLAALAPGMLLAILNVHGGREPRWRTRLARCTRYPVVWWLAAGALFWTTCTHAIANPFFSLDIHGLGWQEMMQPITAFVLLVPLVLAPQPARPLSRVLAWRPLAWIGTVSYGVYLWHGRVIELDVVQRTLREGGAGRGYPAIVAGTLLALVLSLAAGAASWYLLERPLLRFGRRAESRRTPRRTLAAG